MRTGIADTALVRGLIRIIIYFCHGEPPVWFLVFSITINVKQTFANPIPAARDRALTSLLAHEASPHPPLECSAHLEAGNVSAFYSVFW